MTTPGPKPKPTPIRVFEGNPGNLPINQNEPQPQKAESLECVDWLLSECEYMALDKFPTGEVARMIWAKLAPELDRLGVLTEIDRDKFGRYCDTFARWLKMKAFIDRNGEAFPIYGGQFEPMKNPDGSPVFRPDGSQAHEYKKVLKRMQMFPQVAIYAKLADQLRRYEEEFGIGAASRTRISTIVKNSLNNGGQSNGEKKPFDYASERGLRMVK